MSSKQTDNTARRKARVRRAIKAVANGRARLSVHRTGKQIYAQIIDDVKGVTLASASSLDKDIRADIKSGANIDAASTIGRLIAERGVKAGVKDAGRGRPRGRAELLTIGRMAMGEWRDESRRHPPLALRLSPLLWSARASGFLPRK
jgi:large subunit ribosomal protein L18